MSEHPENPRVHEEKTEETIRPDGLLQSKMDQKTQFEEQQTMIRVSPHLSQRSSKETDTVIQKSPGVDSSAGKRQGEVSAVGSATQGHRVIEKSSQPPLLQKDILALSRMERVPGWGMAHAGDCYVVRPSSVEQIKTVLKQADSKGMKVTLRGAGQSYGDASTGQNSVVIDCTRLNRILSWDPMEGIIDVEAGVTVADIWRYTLEDGWWPPVVSGTMRPTMAGAAAMNFHGKNNYKVGPIGDHILEFDLLTAQGLELTCSREQNEDIFHAAISSFGILGIFTRVKLKLKRIYSGNVEVGAISTASLGEMVEHFEQNLEQDYLVGWVDCIAPGEGLGRGLIHVARHLAEGEDHAPESSLKIRNQELPDTLFGFFPKSMVWLGLWFFSHRWGMRLVNAMKYFMGKREAKAPPYLQSHAGFNFLLDYVPNWKWAYKPGGLIQYQTFVPKEHAVKVFEQQLKLAQEAKIPPFLGVLKKHRPDPFLMTHALDGYSFALDLPVTRKNRRRLQKLVRAMNQVTIEHGGRFYFAKDGTLQADEVAQAFPPENLQKLDELKQQLDPEGIFETDLYNRLFRKS